MLNWSSEGRVLQPFQERVVCSASPFLVIMLAIHGETPPEEDMTAATVESISGGLALVRKVTRARSRPLGPKAPLLEAAIPWGHTQPNLQITAVTLSPHCRV